MLQIAANGDRCVYKQIGQLAHGSFFQKTNAHKYPDNFRIPGEEQSIAPSRHLRLRLTPLL